MKCYFRIILFFLVSTVFAEVSKDSKVSYPYDIEMNDDEYVIKYLADCSYYDQFSAEVVGIYVINKDVPMKIDGDLEEMAKILDHYINLKKDTNLSKIVGYGEQVEVDNFKKIVNVDVFAKFCHKYLNNHTEMRHINLILSNTNKYEERYNLNHKIENYIKKKKEFYLRQNNKEGISFCNEIEKLILNPLGKITSTPATDKSLSWKPISILTEEELKLLWKEFQDTKLGLIQAYFNANNEKLQKLDANNVFQIDLRNVKLSGVTSFYICLKIFNQNWYLRVDDYYPSYHHKVSLIEL